MRPITLQAALSLNLLWMILSVSWFTLSAWGVRLLCRWIRLCLNITCPREMCIEGDLVNGNLSITISRLAVHSITACLPACPTACPTACNYLLIWPTEPSSSNGCVWGRGVSIVMVVMEVREGGVPLVYCKKGTDMCHWSSWRCSSGGGGVPAANSRRDRSD